MTAPARARRRSSLADRKRRIVTALQVRVFDPPIRALSGVGRVLPDDDTAARRRALPRLHSATVRAVGTELVTVRIDLEP